MTEEPSVPTPSKPVETPSTGLFERLMTLVGLKHAPSIREDIEDALAEADIGSEFSQRERDMLKNVLGLRANRVQDVMVPRADIVAVSADISLGELLRLFRTAGHSRFPVYHETLDDPRGMIHIRDFVGYVSERAERKPGSRRRKTPADSPDLESLDLSVPLSSVKMLRPVLFVPPSMLALDLLVKMQTTRTHMALVIDEYGGTDGLVSIEDLVEIVVGEIEDEHDLEETPMIQSSVDGTYVVDARADLKDVSAAIGVDLSQGEDAEEIDTIGGLVGMLAGRVPVRGQIIPGPGTLEFEVLDADPRRVKRVRIQQQAVKQTEPTKPKRRSKTQAAEASGESAPDTDKA
jgi:CBS domain containing-hemolysin-like protein